jgi:L-iditol 2-dehydrogenase
MKAAIYTQGAGLAFAEQPVPEIQPDELLVRVEAASICGTDLKVLRYGHRKLREGQTIILGHEFVGRIEEAGANVSGFPLGSRVGVAPNIGCGHCEMCARALMNMCPDYSAFGIDRDGGHTEYVRIPAAAIAQGNVIPLSEAIPAADWVLCEPLSCAINGVRSARINVGDSVLIYGAGPMGLLNLVVAGHSGAARLIMVDHNDSRLELAKQIGATDVLNPRTQSTPDWVAKHTKGRGVDAVITAASARQVQEEAVRLLAPFGRLCLFAGLPRNEKSPELDTNLIHYRNLIVTGTTGGSPHDYRTAMKLIQGGRIPVDKIVSDRLPLSDLSRGYELAQTGKRLKIVFTS